MFESGLRESGEKEQPIVIRLPASDVQPFQALIRFLYTDEVPGEEDSLVALLRIADQFESLPCVVRCVSALTALPMSLEKTLVYLGLPETIKRLPEAKPLMDAVTKFVGLSFEELAAAASIEEFPLASMKRLLDARIGGDSEELLFSCFLRWVRSNGHSGDREALFDQLAVRIKFAFMEPDFLEKDVASVPEMQTSLGQLYIQEARTFQSASVLVRKQLLDRCNDRRLMPRQGPNNVHPQVRQSREGTWIVDAIFPVHESVTLEQSKFTLKDVVVVPGVSLAVKLVRMPPISKKTNGVDTVGLFILLKALPAGCGRIVTARYTFSFLNKEDQVYVSQGDVSEFERIFDDKATDWGIGDIRMTWKDFCFRGSPLLLDGNLNVRVTFNTLLLD